MLLGDQGSAKGWTWHAFTLAFPSAGSFVDSSTSTLKLRYSTTTKADNSQLDYVAVSF